MELTNVIGETKNTIVRKWLDEKALKLAPIEQQYDMLCKQRETIESAVTKVNKVSIYSY